MDWKNLPSLAALRAFEATARHTTYAAAAVELNVTDAALRQHVRTLEARFSRPLVRRAGRGIELTDEGISLAKALATGFGAIAEGVADMDRTRANQPVRVACTPAFAETWLMPRLPDFWSRYPQVEVDLAPSLRNVDLAGGAYDLAIRYGRGGWGWPDTARIASAAYTIVAAPTYNRPTDDNLNAATWLFEVGRTEHKIWATDRGLDYDGPSCRFYPTNSLVLSAVRAGHGISVQAWALVESDISHGTLHALETVEDDTLAYYLLTASPRSEALKFRDWLLEEHNAEATEVTTNEF